MKPVKGKSKKQRRFERRLAARREREWHRIVGKIVTRDMRERVR